MFGQIGATKCFSSHTERRHQISDCFSTFLWTILSSDLSLSIMMMNWTVVQTWSSDISVGPSCGIKSLQPSLTSGEESETSRAEAVRFTEHVQYVMSEKVSDTHGVFISALSTSVSKVGHVAAALLEIQLLSYTGCLICPSDRVLLRLE